MSVGFEIHHPQDLQGKGVFFYSGDPITPKLYAAIGGITPKQLTINEVLPNLTGGAINVLHDAVHRRRAAPVGLAHHAHEHRDAALTSSAATIASSARIAVAAAEVPAGPRDRARSSPATA